MQAERRALGQGMPCENQFTKRCQCGVYSSLARQQKWSPTAPVFRLNWLRRRAQGDHMTAQPASAASPAWQLTPPQPNASGASASSSSSSLAAPPAARAPSPP